MWKQGNVGRIDGEEVQENEEAGGRGLLYKDISKGQTEGIQEQTEGARRDWKGQQTFSIKTKSLIFTAHTSVHCKVYLLSLWHSNEHPPVGLLFNDFLITGSKTVQ